MPKPEALILDFDGVLADTVGAHTIARIQAFKDLGHDVDAAIHAEGHRHGSHPPEIIGWILQEAGIVPRGIEVEEDPVVVQVVARKSELYFEHAAAGLEAIPGSIDFARAAIEKYGHERMAIATTATFAHEVKPFLRRHGLLDGFSVVVAKEQTPKGQMKPHPFVYLEAQKQLGLVEGPNTTVALEDSPRGILAAKAAGLAVMAITTTHPAGELGQADRIFSSFDALSSTLLK